MNAATVRRQNASVTEPQREEEPLTVFLRRFSFCQAFSFAPLAPKEKADDSFLLIKRTVEDACPYRFALIQHHTR